jgi:crotonobetainyl-CoA:carnitine CoA-transferase CaiB-like acyl-CoA transferase
LFVRDYTKKNLQVLDPFTYYYDLSPRKKVDPTQPTYDALVAVYMGCPINTGKQSLLVDIKHSTSGKEILKRLIQWADIVIVNQTSAQLRSLGCDELSMKQINPNVILTHFDAFGGPHHGACIIQHTIAPCK